MRQYPKHVYFIFIYLFTKLCRPIFQPKQSGLDETSNMTELCQVCQITANQQVEERRNTFTTKLLANGTLHFTLAYFTNQITLKEKPAFTLSNAKYFKFHKPLPRPFQ